MFSDMLGKFDRVGPNVAAGVAGNDDVNIVVVNVQKFEFVVGGGLEQEA